MKNPTSELRLIMICADLKNKKLRVPKDVINNAHIFTRGEAILLNEYRNKYPDFEIIVV